MDFCQSVFSNDEYKYYLEDHPCPHVGLVGCEESTRSAIINAFAGLQYRPARLRASSHESLSTVYTKKSSASSKNMTGIMKLGWWKKHQERVLGCAVLLIDWDATQAPDRLQFEALMQKHLDTIKSHLKVPYGSNTKIIIGLVCSAKGLSDPSPCGCYVTIEEAQSALRSRLGLNDRNLLALYQRGMDQYSVQRLEGMVMEQVGRYHKDEIARLRKAKNEASETAATMSMNDNASQDVQHGAGTMEAVLIARNRFKIAWHATVSKDMKLARRSWEKCYNALHSLPPPLSLDRWVVATIALWKLISDNFMKFNNGNIRDAGEAGASIETDIQAFLIHLNWVVDVSFSFHGGPSDKALAARPGEPTPALVVADLTDEEALHVMAREWYLADFYSMVASRLDSLKDFLPKPGSTSLGTRIVCLPAFHLQSVVKCLSRVKDVMVSRLNLLKKDQERSSPVVLERVRPQNSPMFLGREGYDANNYLPFLTTLTVVDVLARVKANIFNAIVWYQSYGLPQFAATMQLEVAENDCFIGAHGDAIHRLNRLMKDPLLCQWPDIRLALHELRYKATRALLEIDGTRDGRPETASVDSPVPMHARNKSGTDTYFMTHSGGLAAHRDMLASLLYLLFHSSNTSRAHRYKHELGELSQRLPLTASFSKAGIDTGGGGGGGTLDSVSPASPVFVDVTPVVPCGADDVDLSATGEPSKMKGFGLSRVMRDNVVIFPLFKTFVHFTKIYLESWKGAAQPERDECASSIKKRPSAGLTVSIECSATTPLRLYNIELRIYHVTQEAAGGRRRRVLVPSPVRLCWFGDEKPSHFVEVSSKTPVWSTTIYSLPFLSELEAGTYECGGLSASVLVSESSVSSVVAKIPSGCGSETYESVASRLSVGCGEQQPRPLRGSGFSGMKSCYASLPPQSAGSTYTQVPIYYNLSSAVEDSYLSMFEEWSFDTAENRIHTLLTKVDAHTSAQQVVPHSGLIGGSRRKSCAPDTFALGKASQRPSASCQSSFGLAALANMLQLEGHWFGAGSTPGCYYSHLHRPVICLAKPVPKLLMTAVVPENQQVLEGDDYIVPLLLESLGDTLINGRLLIPYLEDIVELVEVKDAAGGDVDIRDVTGDSPEIICATPVGYRIAEIVLEPHSIKPAPSTQQRNILNIRFRCSYAGLFELPLRLNYTTPRCDTMSLLHTLRVHVCRPFKSSFKMYNLCLAQGKEGFEKVLPNTEASVPDLAVTTASGPLATNLSSSVFGGAASFDPFTDSATVPPTTLLPGALDLTLSEYMSICHGEHQKLVSVARVAEIQKAFDRDPRTANVVVNLAALRLFKAYEVDRNTYKVGTRQEANAQFYHVERTLSIGQSIQISPSEFRLHQHSPFVVRACFINTIRCPVRIDKLEVQLAEGVSATFRSDTPSRQVLLPAEEITFALQLKVSRAIPADECMGKLALYVRRVSEVKGRTVDPSVATLCGGGLPLRFLFHFPRVPVEEQVFTCKASHPTTLFVGEPFVIKVSLVNSSAVPSKKLRLHFSGPSLDRYFVLTGRVQSSFTVPGLGSVDVPVTMTAIAAGSYNLPTFEVVSEDDVLIRSQDFHIVSVLPRIVKRE